MTLTGLLCVLAALGCLGTQAVAATRYDVEVIVFRNLAASDDGEQWPENTTVASDGFASTPLQQGLENLPDSQFALNGVAGALQRSGAYQVLAHRLWRQSAYDRHSAVPYLLHTTPGSSDHEVDGSITLIRERYLHLAVDLTLTSPDVRVPARRDTANAQRRAALFRQPPLRRHCQSDSLRVRRIGARG